jgi:hypothetical protein
MAAIVPEEEKAQALDKWHRKTSDSDQRKMMRAVMKKYASHKIKLCGEIEFLLSEVEALNEPRNDTTHALYGVNLVEGRWELVPFSWTGHRRAGNLAGKDLLVEFGNYRRRMQLLLIFAESLEHGVNLPDNAPWPRRPKRDDPLPYLP